MGETVIGRYHPQPGVRAEDLEIPGPGVYEADFGVPDWLVPDLDVGREFEIKRGENLITHHRSTIKGNVLTVRFSVERIAAPPAQTIIGLLGPLTVGIVARAVFVIVLGTLGVLIVQAIVDALREVRKIGETPAGIGLAALGVAGALVLARKG
jgi:hypothetical protein